MRSVRLALAAMPDGRRFVLMAAGLAAMLAIIVLASAFVLRTSSHRHDATSATAGASAVGKAPDGPALPGGNDPGSVAADLDRLRGAPVVQPATSSRYPAIPMSERSQPDLYARAFVTELLTQDYRTSRGDLLSWVQSESTPTTEQLVVGLVPDELRSKLGVWTVTESTDGSQVPIPSDAEWRAWGARGASISVEILRVAEPTAWTDAVSTGRITDAGVTARDVDAVVTTHWIDGGRAMTAKRSVFISLTLEGPPARSSYGYVSTVTYRTAPIGG